MDVLGNETRGAGGTLPLKDIPLVFILSLVVGELAGDARKERTDVATHNFVQGIPEVQSAAVEVFASHYIAFVRATLCLQKAMDILDRLLAGC